MKDSVRCYNQIKEQSKEQTLLQIQNIEINVNRSKTGFFQNKENHSVESLANRIYLHVYTQDIVYLLITYLQLVK